MERNAKIYIAGHRGLVGSAVVRKLKQAGFTNLGKTRLCFFSSSKSRGYFSE